MNNKSLVSITIPTYNNGKFIKKAIESALSQTYQNIEVVVVDDGSTDKTKEIILPYLKDKRVKYIYQRNQGVSKARNTALRNSKGRYIAPLDSDDFWSDPQKLEKEVAFLEKNPDHIVVGGGMIRIDKEGNEIDRIFYPERDEIIRKAMLFFCPFAQSTTLFRREGWERVGGYNENCDDLSEDWQLWLELGKIGKMYNFPEYFLYYLQGEQNRSNYNTLRNLKFNIKLRKQYKNSYPNYRKAVVLGWIYYFYFFIPFKKYLHSFFSKIRKLIFGSLGQENSKKSSV